MTERPLILVSNDDGVHAEGLAALRRALLRLGDVFVVAPEREQSATSHRITLSIPLRHRELSERVHCVDGTPADCVYVAMNLQGLLPRKPDVIVSGINHGLNLGMDVVYSGTVAAAREGALRGLRAIALSAELGSDFARVAEHGAGLVERLLSVPDAPALLNVNYPRTEPRGVRATRLGRRHYHDLVEARMDPRGRSYYWIGGPVSSHCGEPEADTTAIDEGYVSITPLMLELTHHAQIALAAHLSGEASEATLGRP